MAGAAGLIGERLFEGDVKTPMAIIATGIGANVAARMLAAPASAAAVARWAKAYNLMLNKGPAALSAYDLATRNLANTAATQAGIPAAKLEQQINQQVQTTQ